MKNVFASMLIALSLAACGGGGSIPQDSPSVLAPVVNSKVYTAVINNSATVTIPGQGQTEDARRISAATAVASSIKPGTDDYRLLLSDGGLKIALVDDEKTGSVVYARIKADGLHIDAK